MQKRAMTLPSNLCSTGFIFLYRSSLETSTHAFQRVTSTHSHAQLQGRQSKGVEEQPGQGCSYTCWAALTSPNLAFLICKMPVRTEPAHQQKTHRYEPCLISYIRNDKKAGKGKFNNTLYLALLSKIVSFQNANQYKIIRFLKILSFFLFVLRL